MSNELKELDAFHLSVFMQIFTNPKFGRSFRRSLQSRFPQTYGYIDARYPQLDGRKFSEKCYWLMNGYEDFPKCPICGKAIHTYMNIVKGYSLTCSFKCGGIFKDSKYVKYPYFISSEKLDEVFRDMLRQLKLDFHSGSYKNIVIKNYPYIQNYIYFRYSHLDGHEMPEKVYWFVNNLHEFPKCQVCGKEIKAFRNAALGYAKYCPKCCYDDLQHGNKISQSWYRHKSEDPEFLSRKLQKTIDTNVKNGHPPTWNNNKKAQQTIEEYLKDDPAWRNKCVQKGKATKKKRYGDENYNNSAKAKQTCIDKYGVDSFSKTKEFIEKTKATNQKNFGVDFVMQSNYGKFLFRQSMLSAYGCENPAQIDAYRAKWKEDKDFVERRQQKMYATKRKNGTFNSSKPEDVSYTLLCEVFGKNDIERQHKDDRYPFLCDFYVKSKDLYIECNYHWTHGKHWFDEKCEDDLKTLQQLKQKNIEKAQDGHVKNMYANAIYVWTQLDLKKRDAAIKNQLNYKVFWNIGDFHIYIDSLKQSK